MSCHPLFAVPLALIAAWLLDIALGDPAWLPHPVVAFGRMIAFGERRLNRGSHRRAKGGVMAVALIVLVFAATALIRCAILPTSAPSPLPFPQSEGSICLMRTLPAILFCFDTILIFFCLAGTTLIREVREVFRAVERSTDEGRRQVARIVGRDTSELTPQEIRTAALETLAENLSDGVVAPLFWLAIGGVPAMMAYKMVNTLDSMIGYRTERYRDFGCWAAHIDDIANYIPARLTAALMLAAYAMLRLLRLVPQSPTRGLADFIRRYGRCHASPNSGYPEAALAAILGCRFGGPHRYFGELFPKPYIGDTDRELTTADMVTAVRVNRAAELMAVVLCGLTIYGLTFLLT